MLRAQSNPCHPSFFMSWHVATVATLSRPCRCCLWTLGKSKQETGGENFRFLACLMVIGFWGQNALIFHNVEFPTVCAGNRFRELIKWYEKKKNTNCSLPYQQLCALYLQLHFNFNFNFHFHFDFSRFLPDFEWRFSTLSGKLKCLIYGVKYGNCRKTQMPTMRQHFSWHLPSHLLNLAEAWGRICHTDWSDEVVGAV